MKRSLKRVATPLAALLLTLGAGWAAGATAAAAQVSHPSRVLERREGYVDGCGAVIYYELIGRGRPLIVLHGGPGVPHGYFLPYLLPLAKHHELVFIDERGGGRSQRLTDQTHYTLDAMVCDIDAVRAALGLGKTDVLGHSFGGILAQAYAIQHAQQVRRLILAGTGSSAARVNADFSAIKAGLEPSLRARIEALEAKGIFGADGAQSQDYRKLADEAELPYNYVVRNPTWDETGEPFGWDVLAQMWGRGSDFHIDGNLSDFDFTPSLRRLTLPTLLIYGDHDIVGDATLQQSHAALVNSTVVKVAHSGHMSFVDQNDAFLLAVARFLER